MLNLHICGVTIHYGNRLYFIVYFAKFIKAFSIVLFEFVSYKLKLAKPIDPLPELTLHFCAKSVS